MIIVITTMNSNSITLNSIIIKRNNYNSKYSLSIATVLELIAINIIVIITINSNSTVISSTSIHSNNNKMAYYYQ